MNRIAASIMCADQLNLKQQLEQLERADISLLHCDVMDGSFVNNLAMGPYILEAIKANTSIPLDIHLATVNPHHYIEMFSVLQPEYISFHIEASHDPIKDIAAIKEKNIKAGLAINPETPVDRIYPYLSDVDMVLMMTVNPGFSGQRINENVFEKMATLQTYLEKKGLYPIIEVDGNINKETASRLKKVGASYYVLGTSALFNQNPGTIDEKIQELIRSIE